MDAEDDGVDVGCVVARDGGAAPDVEDDLEDLLPGSALERFVLLAKLGRGGFGVRARPPGVATAG